jgi:hypothetical protein
MSEGLFVHGLSGFTPLEEVSPVWEIAPSALQQVLGKMETLRERYLLAAVFEALKVLEPLAESAAMPSEVAAGAFKLLAAFRDAAGVSYTDVSS